MEKNLKKIVDKHALSDRKKVMEFIKDNPEDLSIEELSRIAEIVNNKRTETAAYYTDFKTLSLIEEYLPNIEKETIRVLEPSAGVGNFLSIIINKYKNAKKLIIDFNDIDEESIALIKLLNQFKQIPSNVEINYFNHNFLTHNFEGNYDLIIGNPPFLKLSKARGLDVYSSMFEDNVTKNIAGFFLQKASHLSENVVLVMPKYFLHNPDFSLCRERINKFSIEKIVDFGEKGFKGVLIETIALFINTYKKPGKTISYSVTKDLINIQKQSKITSDEFPSWIIYRNDFFDNMVSKMTFNIFSVFRDRQITNKLLKSDGEIRVLKSRNILRDGSDIINIDGYDRYIDCNDLKNCSVIAYLDRDDVYLCPNMTYYPRLIKKPKNTVVNGSVAILENKSNYKITDKDLEFFSGELFEEFYKIARNFSTRSLNIDSNSVKFFGLKR